MGPPPTISHALIKSNPGRNTLSPRNRLLKAMSKPLSHLLLFVITLILCSQAHGRYNIPDGGLDLVSDGVHRFGTSSSSYLTLNRPVKAESTCEETYGFLPCTTTVLGNLFLIIVYGSLMFLAATYLSNGSELLLEILGPGIIGGLFLPILGALPDAMLILGQSFFLRRENYRF